MQILNEIRLTDEEVETLNKAIDIIDKLADATDRQLKEVFDFLLMENSTYDNGYKVENVISMYELNNW